MIFSISLVVSVRLVKEAMVRTIVELLKEKQNLLTRRSKSFLPQEILHNNPQDQLPPKDLLEELQRSLSSWNEITRKVDFSLIN
jgi:hypothetical protein